MPETMRGFKILKDHVNSINKDGFNRVGLEVTEWKDGRSIGEGPVTQFRLYDDDGELYYEGVFGDNKEEEVDYEAVLNYGTWDAGCTTLKVKRGRRWVQEIG